MKTLIVAGSPARYHRARADCKVTRKPLDEQRKVADEVSGTGLPCGHFLPEEKPRDTCARLAEFFLASPPPALPRHRG